MTGTGCHLKMISHIFFQCFDFGWGFDNDKRFGQNNSF